MGRFGQKAGASRMKAMRILHKKKADIRFFYLAFGHPQNFEKPPL